MQHIATTDTKSGYAQNLNVRLCVSGSFDSHKNRLLQSFLRKILVSPIFFLNLLPKKTKGCLSGLRG